MAIIAKVTDRTEPYDFNIKPGQIVAASDEDIRAQSATLTGMQMQQELDRRIAMAMAGPYSQGKLMDAVNMRIFKAENGYALVVGEKLYVCPSLEDVSASLINAIAGWEMDK